MKRLSLFFALSIVLLSFGLANAVGFEAHVEAGKDFVHPDPPGGTYYMGDADLFIAIGIQNIEVIDHTGWKMGVQVYSNPSGATVTWIPLGFPMISSIEMLNKWQHDELDPSRYWKGMNALTTPDWDGNLPDNFAHDVLGDIMDPEGGFHHSDTEMLDRFRLHLNVDVVGHDQSTDIIEICLDKVLEDWLFPPESGGPNPDPPFGPFCFEFLGVPDLHPVIVDPAIALTTEHDVAFDVTYDIFDAEGGTITGVGALDEGGTPIGTATLVSGQINWTFDPPCSWVTERLSHTVRLYAEEAVHTYPDVKLTPPISLTVTNTAPVIDGDCDAEMVAGVDADTYAYFTSTDANVGDIAVWSYTVLPSAPVGPVDLTGGVLMFTPDALDEAVGLFTFTVRVTDCADDFDECDVTFEVISEIPFEIVIEVEDGSGSKGPGDGVYLGHHAYVDVTQVDGSEHNLGFDFLIAYDNSALAFMGAYGNPALFAIPGTYEWEYFTYRFVDNCGGSCPSGLLQVVAIADQNNGMHHPLIVDLTPTPPGDPMLLFTMDFMVTNDYTLECTFVPISWFWRDCSDNSIAMHFRSALDDLEVIQAISRDVFAYNGAYYTITDPLHGFPTYYGAQDECLLIGPDKFNVAFIDFFNGGIKIICNIDIDDRGDINLNGVRNEIADAVVFTNYFIHGMAAFTINLEGQKAATDVNADGIPLSVADLVYLIRIIVGDILMIPDKLSPNTVAANFGHQGELITVDVELGAALFVLEGNVDVSLAHGAAHMDLKSGIVNGNTHALVYSFVEGATFSGDILNTEGKLISVEATDYYSSAYKTIALPTSFSVENYPNPFNAATTISMALPVATNWNLTIYNVAGQKVAEFSGFAEAGMNNVVWDSPTAASGIYFYKVTTDSGSMTKKMVLLK